jgi:hypothetical protein
VGPLTGSSGALPPHAANAINPIPIMISHRIVIDSGRRDYTE